MAKGPENHSLGARHRRVLKMLAEAAHGRDVNALLARGFGFETMADLVMTVRSVPRNVGSNDAPP